MSSGPLSPLLSNVLLTELDRELERRGHAFCRYADDCNIYVKSQQAGERVMASITRFLADTLKLTVNAAKSAVARPWERKFPGYSLTWHKSPKLKIAPTSLKRQEDKIREVLKGARGRSLKKVIDELNPILRGWMAYFKLTETKRALEEIDGWIRRKLRCILWRQWKRPYTRAKNLMKAGLTEERAFRSAFNQRGPWWNSGASHMNQAFPKSFFDRLGRVSLLDTLRRLQCVQPRLSIRRRFAPTRALAAGLRPFSPLVRRPWNNHELLASNETVSQPTSPSSRVLMDNLGSMNRRMRNRTGQVQNLL